MFLCTQLGALLFMVLMATPLYAHKCHEPLQGPPGPAGANGINPHEVYAWVQSNFGSPSYFQEGDDVLFSSSAQMLNGITYNDPAFTFQSAGYYQATFEGYLSYIDSVDYAGLQFFLNDAPVGGSYAPMPADFTVLNPYLYTIQAIFQAAPNDVLTVRVIGSNGSYISFDLDGGSASADIKIVKLSN